MEQAIHTKQWPHPKIILFLIIGGLIIAGLFMVSDHNYLLFHSATEMFSVAIAFTVFAIAWNSREIAGSRYIVFLGIAYLFIGTLDLVHTLAYKGMGVFSGYTESNVATQLWISARYLESLSLLAAPLFCIRRMNVSMVAGIYAVITIIVLLIIFYWEIFPDVFREGSGLTAFKKISEYIICGILIGAIAHMYRQRSQIDNKMMWILSASIVLTMGAELCFTFYVSVYGFSNFVGHLLKVASFYLIYQAIVVSGMTRPFETLFRGLKQNEDRLEMAQEVSGVGNWEWNVTADTITWSKEMYRIYSIDKKLEPSNGMVRQLIHPDDIDRFDRAMSNAFDGSAPDMIEYRIMLMDGIKHIQSRAYCTYDNSGNLTQMFGTVQDITERKKADETIKEGEERLRSTLASMDDLVFVLDSEGKFAEYYQPLKQSELHVPPDEFIGRSFKDVMPEPVVEKINTALDELKRSLNVQQVEYSLDLTEGIRWFNTKLSARTNAKGELAGVTAVARDVTEQKQAQKALGKRTEELEKFERAAIGREMKMIELKKRIAGFEEDMAARGSVD